MKKILFIIVANLTSAICSAQIFSKHAFEANDNLSLGIVGAYMHFDKGINRGAIGLNCTIKGFYFEIMGWKSPHNENDGAEKWTDNSSFAFHAGYQIPIIKAVRIIPMVGYAIAGEITTHSDDWHIDNNENLITPSISTKSHGFDYGASICLSFKIINIYATATRLTYGGGIGLQF